jgi:hypothetical protein
MKYAQPRITGLFTIGSRSSGSGLRFAWVTPLRAPA